VSINRTLAVIKDELHVALKRETANIIDIGALLVETRRHIRHGEWYPWFEQNFSLSRQSADRRNLSRLDENAQFGRIENPPFTAL
jgi:hypothetical protein